MSWQAESVCQLSLHFSIPAQASEATEVKLHDASSAAAVDGHRRAGLGTEPLYLGFATSADMEEARGVIDAQLRRHREARYSTTLRLLHLDVVDLLKHVIADPAFYHSYGLLHSD